MSTGPTRRRLDAIIRWLADDGQMTPMAVRMIGEVFDAEKDPMMMEGPMPTEPDRTIGPDDEPTMEDLMAWHRTDRPDCPSRWVQMGPAGFRCPACGWWVA